MTNRDKDGQFSSVREISPTEKAILATSLGSHYFSGESHGHSLHIVRDADEYRIAMLYPTNAVEYTLPMDKAEAETWFRNEVRRVWGNEPS